MSRIFGLIRDQVFAALLGAGLYSDAFVIAFRIPNLLRDLFGEGALSSAFVPTFTEYEVKKSKEEAWQLANLVLGTLLMIVGFITLLGIIFAPAIVSLIAPGFGNIEGKRELTILLTRIMFPFLPAVAVAALFMGMLNVRHKFALPAFAPVMFNTVSIIFGLALWFSDVSTRTAVIGWSIGTLCGGLAQALIQLPLLYRLGFRLKPVIAGWRHSAGLKQIAWLMLPAVIALSATNINILVNSILASLLEQGAPSWLMYAFRLVHLPIGVFGVAIGVVTLPLVSRDEAEASREGYQSNVTTSFNLVMLLTIPSAIGLWILSHPIIQLIFEHGAFTAFDTEATALALSFYVIGLPAYSAVKVLAPACFAKKDARTPMIASIAAVIVNVGFNLAVYRTMGFKGLALGTSLGAFTNVSILFGTTLFKHHGIDFKSVLKRLPFILLASAVMGYVARELHRIFPPISAGLMQLFLETMVPIIGAVAVYVLVLKTLRVPEVDLLLAGVKRFVRKR